MHSIRIEQFEGPLDLLLRLIEEEKLDISKVSLAQVADQYLEILRQNAQLSMEELSDFLVIAARLMLLKSRMLLPIPVEDDDGPDLEQQLRMYKEFHEASKVIAEMLKTKHYTYVRETSVAVTKPIFHPPKSLTSDGLKGIMQEILARIEPFVSLPETILEKTVSITERIQHIQTILKAHEGTSLRTLLKDAKSRMDVIVTFLALLELVKQRDAVVAQPALFGDVTIQPYSEA